MKQEMRTAAVLPLNLRNRRSLFARLDALLAFCAEPPDDRELPRDADEERLFWGGLRHRHVSGLFRGKRRKARDLRLGLQVEPPARLVQLCERGLPGRGAQRYPPSVLPLEGRVEVFQPEDLPFVFLHFFEDRTALTTPSEVGLEVTTASPASVSITAPLVMTPLRS